MITANATQIGSFIKLVIVHPDKGNQVTTVASQGEAMRVVYFANRAYMLEKMSAWLTQRERSAAPYQRKQAAELLVLLGYYEHLSFPKLCRVIHTHRQVIEGLALGATLHNLFHYKTVILPLLGDATEIGG